MRMNWGQHGKEGTKGPRRYFSSLPSHGTLAPRPTQGLVPTAKTGSRAAETSSQVAKVTAEGRGGGGGGTSGRRWQFSPDPRKAVTPFCIQGQVGERGRLACAGFAVCAGQSRGGTGAWLTPKLSTHPFDPNPRSSCPVPDAGRS